MSKYPLNIETCQTVAAAANLEPKAIVAATLLPGELTTPYAIATDLNEWLGERIPWPFCHQNVGSYALSGILHTGYVDQTPEGIRVKPGYPQHVHPFALSMLELSAQHPGTCLQNLIGNTGKGSETYSGGQLSTRIAILQAIRDGVSTLQELIQLFHPEEGKKAGYTPIPPNTLGHHIDELFISELVSSHIIPKHYIVPPSSISKLRSLLSQDSSAIVRNNKPLLDLLSKGYDNPWTLTDICNGLGVSTQQAQASIAALKRIDLLEYMPLESGISLVEGMKPAIFDLMDRLIKLRSKDYRQWMMETRNAIMQPQVLNLLLAKAKEASPYTKRSYTEIKNALLELATKGITQSPRELALAFAQNNTGLFKPSEVQIQRMMREISNGDMS